MMVSLFIYQLKYIIHELVDKALITCSQTQFSAMFWLSDEQIISCHDNVVLDHVSFPSEDNLSLPFTHSQSYTAALSEW